MIIVIIIIIIIILIPHFECKIFIIKRSYLVLQDSVKYCGLCSHADSNSYFGIEFKVIRTIDKNNYFK